MHVASVRANRLHGVGIVGLHMVYLIGGIIAVALLLIGALFLRPGAAAATEAPPHRRKIDREEESQAAEDAARREAELQEAANRIRDILDQLDEVMSASSARSDSTESTLAGAQERLRKADTSASLEAIREMLLSEIDHVLDNNRELANELRASRKIMRDQHDRLDSFRIAARIDPLTGVGNRAVFDEALKRFAGVADAARQPTSLIMIDIDHFKKLNDQYGHQVGDRVLSGVARLLKTRMRGRDVVSRYGGEEFGIFMPETVLAEAARVAEDLRAKVECTRFAIDDMKLSVTISLGVSQTLPGMSATAFLKQADDQLYRAKQEGRNRVRGYGI